MKAITIGLLAHVDAGKTTFAEQCLFHTNRIRRRGRVDHRTASLDSHEIERARGMTVFAGQAAMTYENAAYYLVDTPGHVDFSPEMERMIDVMDAAVVIVSAVEGVQGHTETVWRLLEKRKIPTFFFINKTDRDGADATRVYSEIRSQLTGEACWMTGNLTSSDVGDALKQFLAERSDELLEMYVEDRGSPAAWIRALSAAVRAHRAFPCASGSALHDVGVKEWLEQVHLLLQAKQGDQYNHDAGSSSSEEDMEPEPFAGRVYKIRHDDNGTRLTFVKALRGSLSVRDDICYRRDGEQRCEKVTQLLIVDGDRSQAVDRVQAGDLFAITGLSAADAGCGLGDCSDRSDRELEPALISRVVFDQTLHVKDVLQVFQLLDAEDPSLNVVWDEHMQQIHIRIMGVIQLEVLQQIVHDRFGMNVSFDRPQILYKETIQAPVIGYGHFEPLRHYAEVHLRLEPGERNSGIQFKSECHPDQLSTGYQRLIEAHLFERDHHGLLTGSPVTDLRITLLAGRAHNEHTHGGDFREATFRALRQGLEKADNVLLEPYYDVKVKVEIDHLGRVMSDIQRASGQFEPPETTDTYAVIRGRVPVATFMDYSTELASFTHGRGSIQLTNAGYDRCHNEQEVIDRIGYNKDADPLYTSTSIFCSKGSGYSVPWDEAESHMHLL